MTSDPHGQPKKSTSLWVWVGLGCGVLLAGTVAFVGFIVFVVFGSMRGAEPYKHALAQAQTDPRVIALLGSPVRAGYFFSGSINVKNSDGEAELTIPLSGPKGKASLRVKGTKSVGKWTYQEMRVVGNGDEINLLEESPGTTPPVS